MSKLPVRQERFCREYIIDLNATQAYIRAGYSENGASASSSALLAKPKIRQRVAELERLENESLSERFKISRERILKERARLAFFDPRTLYRADGTLKGPSEWDDDTAAVIASIKQNGPTMEIRFWNKDGSLTALEKIEGMYEADNAQRNPYEGKSVEELRKIREEKKRALKVLPAKK